MSKSCCGSIHSSRVLEHPAVQDQAFANFFFFFFAKSVFFLSDETVLQFIEVLWSLLPLSLFLAGNS